MIRGNRFATLGVAMGLAATGSPEMATAAPAPQIGTAETSQLTTHLVTQGFVASYLEKINGQPVKRITTTTRLIHGATNPENVDKVAQTRVTRYKHGKSVSTTTGTVELLGRWVGNSTVVEPLPAPDPSGLSSTPAEATVSSADLAYDCTDLATGDDGACTEAQFNAEQDCVDTTHIWQFINNDPNNGACVVIEPVSDGSTV